MPFQRKFKYYSKEEALKKAQKYCVYQERCHSEIKNKLQELNQRGKDADEIIIKLIEQDFLNEERFAKHFAGGKFRIKKWGKNKIIQELKARKISEYCINKALEEINDEEYFKTLNVLISKKSKLVRAENKFEKNSKIANYLAGKGYEPELIWKILKSN